MIFSPAADLVVLIFNAALKGPEAAGHGVEGYYFAESTTYSALEVAQVISETFVELGMGDKKESTALTQEELDTYLGVRRHF